MLHKQYTNFLSKLLLTWIVAWVQFHPETYYAQVFADQHFRQKAEEAMDLVYEQRHEEAEKLLNHLKEGYSEHPAPYFLLATNRWWQSYTSTTPHYHSYMREHLDKALELNEKLAKNEELELEYIFFQYMCYAFRTRLHTLRREWLKATNDGLKALPYVKKCIKLAEESPEFYFSAGIYHYYAEAYPEEHPYLKPIIALFPDGSATAGLEEMEKSARIKNFTQVESIFYLTDVYIFWEKDYDKAVENIYRLHSTYPSNTWFFAEYARALVFAGRYEKAIPHLEKVIGLFENIAGHQTRHIASTESPLTAKLMIRLYHYHGKALLLGRNDVSKAVQSFHNSLKQAELSGIPAYEYIPGDYLYLGYCYDRLGQRSIAKSYYQKAIDSEDNDLYKSEAKKGLKEPIFK
ncbi:MAG: tetratricopeptide repeat protein [Bacteroidia bacterium]|nr:tetratricopeptide repeat protein [Bacteroidia bacterium]